MTANNASSSNPSSSSPTPSSSKTMSAVKVVVAGVFLFSALSTIYNAKRSQSDAAIINDSDYETVEEQQNHRRLSSVDDSSIPSHVGPLLKDLKERKKLMEETPPEEVKYWFEYTGPLQKYYYRYSKSRGKADYFEGRDDSGVSNSRFMDEVGGGKEYTDFFLNNNGAALSPQHQRLYENCLAMGSPNRPNTDKGTVWYDWFVDSSSKSKAKDRCRILVTLNTVGAGRGTTMLWETNPPITMDPKNPKKLWISEQETAATHLERNLKEIDAMCESGFMAVRLQVLVCEPIPAKWTEWMDSKLTHCGGKKMPTVSSEEEKIEERPSPLQVVVVSSSTSADTCHNLKSGFMEKRMQDMILAPPFLTDKNFKSDAKYDPAVKTTHPDLVSSDDHDMYIALKWSSMVTTRAVHGFLQASADLAAAAASPRNQSSEASKDKKSSDGVTVHLSKAPSSPFLIPSFVRVSYVSEENAKVAKWRMHGDFFHPAAWEVCKDSYDMTWIPDSLSGSGGVKGVCYASSSSTVARKLKDGVDCGQWWIYMAEEQMPTTPEVYANEVTSPIVQGGSNFIWMLTERQRREIVKQLVCRHDKSSEEEKGKCGTMPQAVIPLGDLESFLINFTPNTALGKKHVEGRRPGYSREEEHKLDREKVRERKQLKGQEDIEKALFDYTIYPAALFHKDATVKAARAADAILSKDSSKGGATGPQVVKSSYYDVTITKPREATLGWCQAISRSGLCTLYSDYFRLSNDHRCVEACGMSKEFTKLQA